MTIITLLNIISRLSREKHLRIIKVWDVIERIQAIEDIEKEEIWMLLRKLEKNAFIDVIRAQNAGIIAVSTTPLGELKLED